MRSNYQNCYHDPTNDMDFVREQKRPGGLLEVFFCRTCRRQMRYFTRPRHSKKHDAEAAVTCLVREPDRYSDQKKADPRAGHNRRSAR